MSDHRKPDPTETRGIESDDIGHGQVVSGKGEFCPKQPPKNAIEMLKQLDQMFWTRFQKESNSKTSGK